MTATSFCLCTIKAIKMNNSEKSDLFVTCASGLEPLLAQELIEMGFDAITPKYRGVYVADSSIEAIYRINYCSRIASRVLLPLSRFRCRDKRALYEGANAVDWLKYIPEDKTFAVDANVTHPGIRNSLFAAQVVKDAVCDQFRAKTGDRPIVNPRSPDVQLNLFIYEDFGIISIDTSGEPLHKRGYRQENVEAPIRESLAAAILRLAQYRGDEILYDPCCGSGTFLIEAAMLSAYTPAGFFRTRWGFMLMPEFSHPAWLKIKLEADAKRIPIVKDRFFGSDIGKNAVHASKVNLRSAGFHQAVEIIQCDFREYTPRIPPTFLIANPPHGRRLDDVEFLRPLYRALGDFMKRQMPKSSRGFVFTGNLELAKEVGLAPTQRHVLDNSGIDSRLLEYQIY